MCTRKTKKNTSLQLRQNMRKGCFFICRKNNRISALNCIQKDQRAEKTLILFVFDQKTKARMKTIIIAVFSFSKMDSHCNLFLDYPCSQRFFAERLSWFVHRIL